jgi:hypothetical protein
MLERARPLLTFKLNRLKRKTIEITLPEACDKAMQRDGVEPKPRIHGVGEKAWWLQQILGLIPPKVWERGSGWTISELIEAAERSEWKLLLFEAWTEAALRFRDEEWAGVLINVVALQSRADLLFRVLSSDRQEAVIADELKDDPSLNSVRRKLVTCTYQWSSQLSQTVINTLCRHASTDTFGADWLWQPLFITIGCYLDHGLIPEATARLTEAMKLPIEHSLALERFLDFIQFRHAMLKEINQ